MSAVCLSTKYKKMFLRVLWSACSQSLLSLSDALLSAAKTAVESSGRDVVMTGTSANGASVNYSLAAAVNTIPIVRRVELLEELLELYEAVKAANPDFSEEQIFRAMLASYGSGRRTIAMDFGGLIK